MIIKVIPENAEEKKRIRESEHYGVTDFFVCGNKKDDDGDIVDFHEWSGKYPRLIGPLFYYANFLINEQNVKNASLKGIEAAEKKPFIKRSKPEDGQVKQLISAEDMSKIVEQENTIKFPPSNILENTNEPQPNMISETDKPIPVPIKEDELPVEEPKDNESKGAEE